MYFDKPDIEDLLADESFVQYCKQDSPADMAKWESYLRAYPEQATLVEEAKSRFLSLFDAMAMADLTDQEELLKNRLGAADPAPVIRMQTTGKRDRGNIFPAILTITVGIAALLLLAAGTYLFFAGRQSKSDPRTFAAAYGEKKNLQLPDGSVVILNAGSKISIPDNFGVHTRDIYLKGEAFFDVKHNKALPFIVHTADMDVKALGTAFNVKAYPADKMTEASLVRGLVEVTLKKDQNQKVLLHPNQKIQWKQEREDKKGQLTGLQNDKKMIPLSTGNLIQQLTKTDSDDIKEIAWTENKLVFADESFAEIASQLERWYGVKLEFMNDEIRQYRFTGIFEKEEIAAVLSFLKESRSFNFEIEKGEMVTVKIYR